MAGSDSGSSGADPPSSRSQDRPTIFDDNTRLSRRLFTLVTITILLNTLLWSSVLCLGSSIYQVASDSHDVTNIAPVVLTSISVSVFYEDAQVSTNQHRLSPQFFTPLFIQSSRSSKENGLMMSDTLLLSRTRTMPLCAWWWHFVLSGL